MTRPARLGLAGLGGVAALLAFLHRLAFGSGYLRNFHVPADAMAPTLEKGDSFVALMNGPAGLRRGDIVLAAVGEATYVKRVAALPGDSIALAGGTVILNGRPVAQRFLATATRPETGAGLPVRRFAEQFAGESAPHEILDSGPSDVDEFPELRVPAGHVFLLGDNRDRSADSRVPRSAMGVDLLPLADVKGRPIFCTRRCNLGR